MKKSAVLMSAAISGMLLVAGCASSGGSKTADVAKGECWGANACKGKGDCGGKTHSCAGHNACKGKGWNYMTKAQCDDAGGEYKTH